MSKKIRRKKEKPTRPHANSVEEFEEILGKEEGKRRWIPELEEKPGKDFPTILYRVWYEKPKCKISLVGDGGFLSGAGDIPLGTEEQQNISLFNHGKWAYKKPTAYISATSSADDIAKMWAATLEKNEDENLPSTIAVTIINPHHKFRKRFPIRRMRDELFHYSRKLAQTFINHSYFQQ